MKKLISLGLILSVALFLLNCAGAKTTVVVCNDHPEWVNKGGAAFEDNAFYGVGAASNVSSVSLRRSVADQRARAELARTFSTKIKDLVKAYERSISTGNRPDEESMEQFAQQTTKTFTAMELSGAEIVDHHACPRENTFYSLARLDAESFSQQIQKVKDLPEQVKQLIINNADQAFEELNSESDK